MSLETDIQELTKAVLALTYTLNQAYAAPVPVAPVDLTRTIAAEVNASLVKAEKLEEKKPEVKSKTTTDTSPSSAPESVAVTYDDVKKLIIAISKESKDKAVASLQRFGVANGKQLKPEEYEAVATYLGAVLDGTIDPEESDA
jgi:hypothetical protein